MNTKLFVKAQLTKFSLSPTSLETSCKNPTQNQNWNLKEAEFCPVPRFCTYPTSCSPGRSLPSPPCQDASARFRRLPILQWANLRPSAQTVPGPAGVTQGFLFSRGWQGGKGNSHRQRPDSAPVSTVGLGAPCPNQFWACPESSPPTNPSVGWESFGRGTASPIQSQGVAMQMKGRGYTDKWHCHSSQFPLHSWGYGEQTTRGLMGKNCRSVADPLLGNAEGPWFDPRHLLLQVAGDVKDLFTPWRAAASLILLRTILV